MSTRKELGKITSATFGIGGYQDAMIGLHLEFKSNIYSTSTFIGGWVPTNLDEPCRTKSLNSEYVKTVRKVVEILSDSRKMDVSKLVGVPVEIIWEDGSLKSWRILTEVL